MNILFVIPTLGQGGAQRVLVNLANELLNSDALVGSSQDEKNRNIHVSIATFSSEDIDPHHKPEAGISIYYTGAISGTRTSVKGLLVSLLRLRRIVVDTKPDIIIVFQDIAIYPTIITCVGCSVPVIISERQDTRFYRLSGLRKILRWSMYRFVDKIVVQTELVKNQMPAAVMPKTVVVPNAIPTVANRTGRINSTDEVKEVISIGRLENQKNFPLLIDAAALAFKQNSNWKLTIYGEGSLRKQLEKQILDLSMDSRIRLAGVTADVFDKLGNAHLFVLPSLYEGFPNVLAEASGFGLPCIAFSDVSGVPELIENSKNGMLLTRAERNADDLATVMLDLMNDTEKRDSMGKAGIEMASRYRPDLILDQWIRIINSTLNPSAK